MEIALTLCMVDQREKNTQTMMRYINLIEEKMK